MKLADIANLLSCTLEGDGSIEILSVATLESAREGDLSFLTNSKYYNEAKRTKASAVLVALDSPPLHTALLRNENPYLAFAKAVEIFFGPPAVRPSIHPTAWIADTAVIGAHVFVGPYVIIGERARIEEGAQLHARSVIHSDAVIGPDTIVHSGAVVRDRVVIGNKCVIQSNAVIGSDGFGYAKQANGEWYRIIQAGTVVIEDEVEIGACSTIDRATLGETRIRRGTKIDNQVQIGHGCIVGTDNLICAQTGLAGSTKTGAGVVLTGQVGAAGHLTIGDGVIATPQTGIANSVEAGQTISGAPAVDHRIWLKSSAVFSRLPEIQRTVRELKGRVAALESTLKEKA